jgi:hypothetical protein
MLAYHPALDPYHASFRMLRLLAASPYNLEPDRLRLLDFFLLFPHLLRRIHLPQGLTRRRNQVAGSENRYRYGGQPQLVFRTITPVHDAALSLLATSAWARLEDGGFRLSVSEFPVPLLTLLRAKNDAQAGLVGFLVGDLFTVPLRGRDGLKQRSGLLEYRYDAT